MPTQLVKSKDQIITDLINREGGYVNDPNDLGGETNWGITKYAWQEYWYRVMGSPPPSVKNITPALARTFYEGEYWNLYAPMADGLPFNYHLIEAIMDGAVNHGKLRMNKWLQRAVGAVEDGVIGPKTIGAVRMADKRMVKYSIGKSRIKEYARIVGAIPSQAKYIVGWINRALEFMVD